MFQIWCEWDCGQDDTVFTSEEKAKNWFNSNTNNIEALGQDMIEYEEDDFDVSPFEYYEDKGLARIIRLRVDPE